MIHIGTSGFSYDDWVGLFYPPRTPKGKMFEVYCEWFDAIEINSTFYQIGSPQGMRSLLHRAAGRLNFSVKMSDRVTHHADLSGDIVRRFNRAVEPLAKDGKLVVVLFQFPFRFHESAENRGYLLRSLEAFKELPCVVEIRHDSWQTDDALRFFSDERINLCIVDMPRLRHFPRTMHTLTGQVAYIRFHGRNGGHWFKEGDPGAPYDYDYSEDEIRDWTGPIRELARKAETTLAFFNNHIRAQAPRNALALREILDGRRRGSVQSDLFA